MPVNTKITKLRTSKGWNKKQLADQLNVSAMVITKYERKASPMMPSTKVLNSMAKLFSISIYELTGDAITTKVKDIHEGKALKQYLKDKEPNLTHLANNIGISRNELYYYFNMKLIPQVWLDKVNASKVIKLSKSKFINQYKD